MQVLTRVKQYAWCNAIGMAQFPPVLWCVKIPTKTSIASTVLITVQKHLFKLIPKFMFKYPKVLKI